MRRFDKIAARLAKETVPIDDLVHKLEVIEALDLCDVHDFSQLRLMGLPITKTNERYATLTTRLTPLEQQLFCVVDIESSASDITKGQIIEIGAVMLRGTKEIGRFESLVHTETIPKSIQELTGITEADVADAPSLTSVLEGFRLFLKDAVFVAHNVGFDYYFISASMEQAGFGPMLNRKLCTIDLAQKTIEAERYGLQHLREVLGIDEGMHHRALADAQSTAKVFAKSLENIPVDVCTAEELLYFAKPNQKKRKRPHVKKGQKAPNTKEQPSTCNDS